MEVQREQAPDAGRRRSPGWHLAAARRAGASLAAARPGRPPGVGHAVGAVSDHPRVAAGKQVGDVLVGRGTAGARHGAVDLRADEVVVGGPLDVAEDAHRDVRQVGVVEAGQRERQRRVVGVGVVAHDPSRVGLVAREDVEGAVVTRTHDDVTPAATSSPWARWRMRASPSERSLSTSKTPSLKIGQFW